MLYLASKLLLEIAGLYRAEAVTILTRTNEQLGLCKEANLPLEIVDSTGFKIVRSSLVGSFDQWGLTSIETLRPLVLPLTH